MFVWAPALHDMADVGTIRRSWTFVDLYEAHLILACRAEVEAARERDRTWKGRR